MDFMWAVGINHTSSLIFSLPKSHGGYGFGPKSIGFFYFTGTLAVVIGELIGYWGNDWIVRRHAQNHRGLFNPASYLWPIYPATVFMCIGLVLIGQALQKTLLWVALAFGWGLYICGTMVASVATAAYALALLPDYSAEVSSLFTFSRLIGGFSVGYFQLGWAVRDGFQTSFGIQSAIVASSIAIIIFLHVGSLRMKS
jgi:hypothetical protein